MAALHEMMKPHGGYAEYAISSQNAIFHIPDSVSFEGRLVSGIKRDIIQQLDIMLIHKFTLNPYRSRHDSLDCNDICSGTVCTSRTS